MKTHFHSLLCALSLVLFSACAMSRVMIGDNASDGGNPDSGLVPDSGMSMDAGVDADSGVLCDDCCTLYAQGAACADPNRGPCIFTSGCGAIPDSIGHCLLLNDACPQEDTPVCGCDGVTYGNTCEANSSGVSVWYTGACGTACGGFAEIECAPTEFCDHPIGASASCGGDDSTGVCRERPAGCRGDGLPVCGCDGIDYSSACEANQSGVPARRYGSCSMTEDCRALVTPTSGLVTSEDGDNATFTVVLTCAPTTDVSILVTSGDESEGTLSPASLNFTPADWASPHSVRVTGVDDALDDGDIEYTIRVGPSSSSDPSYDSLDPIGVAVTNVDNDGPSPGRLCGPSVGGDPCDDTEYCEFTVRDSSCGMETPGVCTPRPTGCAAVVIPVCGCDGLTYSNDCVAMAMGISISYDGVCSE